MIGYMEHTIIAVLLAVLGLILGSFAGATVWRLRAKQLVEDKATGEVVDSDEYAQLVPLTKATLATDRSRCLHCGHTLAWYDLLPLVSWASTAGRCRYCHHKIGWFEPLMEVGTALLFVGSYLLWPVSFDVASHVITFGLWLVACVMLVMLLAYDAKWFLLPNKVMLPLTGVAVVIAVIHVASSLSTVSSLISLGVAIVILSGLYLVLWLLSKGRWIGFGDVKLGLALALLLGDWQLAFLTLFAANLLGCLIVIPGMLAGKISRGTHVPFGPLLIVGAVIAMLWGTSITTWYFSMYML